MNAPVADARRPRAAPGGARRPESGIVEVATTAAAATGLIPLWVGEGDLPTPAFICEAATRALAAGETFYTWQRGIPDLRQALARYIERLYGRPLGPGALLRHDRRHAGDPDRGSDDRRRRRRGRDPDAGLAEFRRRAQRRRRAAPSRCR